MARRRRKSGIALPWERQGALVRELLSGQRWKVLIIAVVVIAGGVLVFQHARQRARIRSTRLAISQVQRAITAFRMEVGRCPRSAVELVHPPDSANRYLREMPVDAWGRELRVECPGRRDPYGADVISAGPSGSFFVDDNVM